MKFLAAILPLALFALGACEARYAPTTDQRDGQLTPSSSDAPAGEVLLPQGEFRVAGADRVDVNLGHAITVSIDDDTIALASQCVTPRWTYNYSGGTLATQAIPDPICDRGRYPAEEAAMAVFDAPEIIMRTPENGWYIAGGGRSITLFSQ